MRTLIRDVSIFDGTGSALQTGSVRVDGDRIARVALGDELLTKVQTSSSKAMARRWCRG